MYDKIKKYKDGIKKHQKCLEEVEKEIENVRESLENEKYDECKEWKLNELANSYEFDPEDKEFLTEYGDYAIDVMETEWCKARETTKSLNGQLGNAKLWLHIYRNHFKSAEEKIKEIKTLNIFRDCIKTLHDREFVLSNAMPSLKEVEYYADGLRDGYVTIFTRKSSPKQR